MGFHPVRGSSAPNKHEPTESGMAMTGQGHVDGLGRLDALSDAALHELLARIQALLLDRLPATMGLTVEVVEADEARLLAVYRALPAERRPKALAAVERTLMPAASARARGALHVSAE